jgi:hypothetical protein
MKILSTALGSIPWVGGFMSAAADFKSDEEQVKHNELFKEWLDEHRKKIGMLEETILRVMQRLNEFSDEIDERLASEEYLQIVRKSFRVWDNSDTDEKRELVRLLLTNSGTQKIVYDDLIRLFLDWIDSYHEAHFSVIKSIYNESGITRLGIWSSLNGEDVREDSMEADLYKMLIRDLSTGGVIRQYRPTDAWGNFIKKQPAKKTKSNRLKSAFDDSDGYELTKLGEMFVHYTMNEEVSKIEN